MSKGQLQDLAIGLRPGAKYGLLASWLGTRRMDGLAALGTDPKTRAIDFVFAPVVFIALLFPQYAGDVHHLDHSWMRGLGHFMSARAQAGVDYIYTLGPLGALFTPVFDPSLFWIKYTWTVVLAALLTIITAATARKLPSLDLRVLFYVFWILYASFIVFLPDTVVSLGMLQLACLLFFNERKGAIFYLGPVVFAVLSLVKFTFTTNALAALCLLSACRLIERRNSDAFVPWAIYLGTFVGAWLALGQSINHLPQYFQGSFELASGYAAAVGYESVHSTFSSSLAVLGINGLICALAAARQPRRPQIVFFATFALIALFASWKHGMVRDDEHILNFFDYALVFPFVIMSAAPRIVQMPAVRLAIALSWILSVHAHYVETKQEFRPKQVATDAFRRLRGQARDFFYPKRLRARLEESHRLAMETSQLPLVKAVVGRLTIDVVSCDQSMLLLNQLNWHPRPVFQSCMAYTPALAAANAKFYRGARAPEFVLINLTPIDRRYPGHEDAGVLLELVKSYQPVLVEKSWLLLERRRDLPIADAAETTTAAERTITFGEEVAVASNDGEYQTLALDIRPSRFGKILTTLYRAAPVHLNVTTNYGAKRSYRLIPSMAAGPFLLNPLIADNLSVLEMGLNCDGEYVTSFSVTTPTALGQKSFLSEIGLSLRSFRLPQRALPSDSSSNLTADRLFPQRPRSVMTARATTLAYDGRRCLAVDNPAVVTLDLPQSARRLEGKFGVLPGAYAKDKSHSVEFLIESVHPDGKRFGLWRCVLDPFNVPADQVMQAFGIDLPDCPPECRLEFITTDGAGGKDGSSGCYWSSIRLH